MLVSPFRPLLSTACAVLSLSALAHAGNVIVVSPALPAPFDSIEGAVQTAVNGDLLLVQSGTYSTFLIDGKAIDVVADAGAVVQIIGGARVAHVPAGKRVLLAGLNIAGIAGPTVFGGHGITLIDSPGSIRIERCGFSGADNTFLPQNCFGWGDDTGWEGAVITNCADVAIANTALTGGQGMVLPNRLGCPKETHGGDGGHAIRATNSNVAIHKCSLVAGNGGLGGSGGHGGNGLLLSGGSTLLAGSEARGGNGGVGIDWLFGPGGSGGNGVLATNAASVALLDNALFGGTHAWGFTGSGADGFPYAGVPATTYSGLARSFNTSGPTREGQTAHLYWSGKPNDFGVVAFGPLATQLPLPSFAGVLLVSPPQVLQTVWLGPTGSLDMLVPVGPLGPGEFAVTVPLQSAFLSTSLDVVLGNAAHLVLLDASL